MSMVFRNALPRIAFVGIACMFAAGCGGPARMKTIVVEANLTVDGKPYGPAIVNLSPPEAGSKLPNAVGEVAADGKVTLRSYPGVKGIVPGTYQFSLGPDPMAMNQVPMVRPGMVTINETDKSVELKLNVAKNAKPGTLLDSTPGATTDLALPRP